MKYDDSSFIWLKAKFKIKIASVVLCYFAFPPQRHEESSEKIRLKKWFLCFLSFPLRLTKERSPAKYPVENKGR